MKTNPREILIFLDPESSKDKKTVAYARTTTPYVKTIAHKDNPSTATAWKSILRTLDLHPKKLMNKAHPDYQKNIRGMELDHEGWLNVLQRNPHLIKAPIAIKGKQIILCETPTDIYRL